LPSAARPSRRSMLGAVGLVVALWATVALTLAGAFAEGPETCRHLCPDSRSLPYGGCFVAQAVVDPAVSQCYRCGAAALNETVACVRRATSDVVDFLALVDESSLANVSSAASVPLQLEMRRLQVVVGGSGAVATVEIRVGDRRIHTTTVHSGGQATLDGTIVADDSLIAEGTLQFDETPRAPLLASVYVLVTCTSALSGGASCPTTAEYSYQWMPRAAVTPPPPAASPTRSGSSGGLSTGAIAGIAAACAVVCMAIAGGLAIFFQTRKARAEDAAADERRQAHTRRSRYAASGGAATQPAGAAGGFPIATPRESHPTSLAMQHTDESDAAAHAPPSLEETEDAHGFHAIGEGPKPRTAALE